MTYKELGLLVVSEGIGEDVRADLIRRGHQIKEQNTPIATPVMLVVDQDSGTVHAAGDPAAGRHACEAG
jgi:hypothetical protein